jgi:YHS domain-containing protein
MIHIVRDPVCGELLAWEKAATVLNYQGTLHYFCSIRSRNRFRHAPNRFIQSKQVLLGVP